MLLSFRSPTIARRVICFATQCRPRSSRIAATMTSTASNRPARYFDKDFRESYFLGPSDDSSKEGGAVSATRIKAVLKVYAKDFVVNEIPLLPLLREGSHGEVRDKVLVSASASTATEGSENSSSSGGGGGGSDISPPSQTANSAPLTLRLSDFFVGETEATLKRLSHLNSWFYECKHQVTKCKSRNEFAAIVKSSLQKFDSMDAGGIKARIRINNIDRIGNAANSRDNRRLFYAAMARNFPFLDVDTDARRDGEDEDFISVTASPDAEGVLHFLETGMDITDLEKLYIFRSNSPAYHFQESASNSGTPISDDGAGAAAASSSSSDNSSGSSYYEISDYASTNKFPKLVIKFSDKIVRNRVFKIFSNHQRESFAPSSDKFNNDDTDNRSHYSAAGRFRTMFESKTMDFRPNPNNSNSNSNSNSGGNSRYNNSSSNSYNNKLTDQADSDVTRAIELSWSYKYFAKLFKSREAATRQATTSANGMAQSNTSGGDSHSSNSSNNNNVDVVCIEFTLHKQNVEHSEAISSLSSLLGINENHFTYGGIKDKTAITSQRVCVTLNASKMVGAVSSVEQIQKSKERAIRNVLSALASLTLNPHYLYNRGIKSSSNAPKKADGGNSLGLITGSRKRAFNAMSSDYKYEEAFIRVSDIKEVTSPILLGKIAGNQFIITCRDVFMESVLNQSSSSSSSSSNGSNNKPADSASHESMHNILLARAAFLRRYGFPNYFGSQRMGQRMGMWGDCYVDTNQNLVPNIGRIPVAPAIGKALVGGDFKTLVEMLLLGEPRDVAEARLINGFDRHSSDYSDNADMTLGSSSSANSASSDETGYGGMLSQLDKARRLYLLDFPLTRVLGSLPSSANKERKLLRAMLKNAKFFDSSSTSMRNRMEEDTSAMTHASSSSSSSSFAPGDAVLDASSNSGVGSDFYWARVADSLSYSSLVFNVNAYQSFLWNIVASYRLSAGASPPSSSLSSSNTSPLSSSCSRSSTHSSLFPQVGDMILVDSEDQSIVDAVMASLSTSDSIDRSTFKVFKYLTEKDLSDIKAQYNSSSSNSSSSSLTSSSSASFEDAMVCLMQRVVLPLFGDLMSFPRNGSGSFYKALLISEGLVDVASIMDAKSASNSSACSTIDASIDCLEDTNYDSDSDKSDGGNSNSNNISSSSNNDIGSADKSSSNSKRLTSGTTSAKSLRPKGAYRVLLQVARDIDLENFRVDGGGEDSNVDISSGPLSSSSSSSSTSSSESPYSLISTNGSSTKAQFTIRFSLTTGSYATVFLRELLMNNELM